MRTERRPDYRWFDAFYNRTVVEPDLLKGGWSIQGGYRLEYENRFPVNEPQCTSPHSELNDQIAYSYKLSVIFPDGSRHEMIPYGHNDRLNDRYFNVTMDGYLRSCYTINNYTTRPVYYSLDGSYLRLESTSQTNWTLYFPDGSKVVGGRQYDRNANWVDEGYGAEDQLGRTVLITWDSNGDQLVTSKGFQGEDVVWRIKWKTIAVQKEYQACTTIDLSCPGDDFPLPNKRDLLQASFTVVDKIFQPPQLGGGVYAFSYNGSNTPINLPDRSYGWGELSGVELPSGAKVTYDYKMDGEEGSTDIEGTKYILKNHVIGKTLMYDLEYDGQMITTVRSRPGATRYLPKKVSCALRTAV